MFFNLQKNRGVKMAKKEKAEKVKKVKKETFIKSTREEMKKVVWPSGKDVFKFSLITLAMIVFFMVFFVGINLLASFVKGLFI